jgi:ABC-type dipeptide/oligopeptide/nickel transport system permease component
MTRLIVSRLATLIPLMLIATSIVFFLVRFVPGDPVRIMVGGQRISPQNVESIRHQYRLDKPVLVQYGYWLNDLAHGSLGDSFRQRAPVRDLVLDRLPITLKLATYSFILSMVISIPLGIISALRRNSWVDVGASFFSLIGASSPVFFTSILLILIFAYKLQWMPALGQGDGGWDTVKHLTLPAIALGLSLAAITTRITRNGMIEVLSQDYMVTARAKGLSPRSIVFKHALRNALVPIVTVAGLQFGFLLAGTVLVEYTFGIGGLGSLLVDSVQRRDYPVVQGATVFIAIAFIILNLTVDILYAIIDPRVKY